MAEFSNSPYSPAQEGTVTLPTTADTSEISGISLTPSSWSIAESNSNELRWQQQAPTPLSESIKEPLSSSNPIADCVNHSPNQTKPPNRRKRSQFYNSQKADFCPAQQLLQIKPGTDQKVLPPSGSDERRGPWPVFEDGDDIENRILLLMLTQGVEGVANSRECWQDSYMQVPVCTPLNGFRKSPAQVIEPCRLCKRYFLLPTASILRVQGR